MDRGPAEPEPTVPPPPRWVVPWWQAATGCAGAAAAGAGFGPAAGAAGALLAAVLLALAARAGVRRRAAALPPARDIRTEPAAGAVPRGEPLPGEPPLPPAADTVVFYRPLRSLPELHLRGMEAELRWRQPQLGLQSPADWPPALAPALAQALLDRWLAGALSQFAAWLPLLRPRGGATLWLRLPPALLAVDALAQRVGTALAAHGLDASQLVLRVPLRVQGRLAELPAPAQALQAAGVSIAVDGFGAGSASLSHLERLPVRSVCLAPSFVARAGPATPQRWVVESTARLAHTMGMSTLADGVAQDSQVLALALMGCDLGVGEVCGPWLEAGEWQQRWAGAQPVCAE